MGSPRSSLKRSMLLSGFLALALLSTLGFAQNDRTTRQTSTTARPGQQTTSRSSSTTSQTSSPNTSRTSTPNTQTTGAPQPTREAESFTNTVTLTRGGGGVAVPTYPAPTVPPTEMAPFMNRSSLPDGTVFIAVGAILGAFGLAILAWRGIIACLLHRSVERAAMAQHTANDKTSFPAPPSQFYKYLERDPSPTQGAANRIHRKSQRGPAPLATPSQTNLFFSPTAAPGGPAGLAGAGGRDSRYLPSGFYASASPMPNHSSGNSINLSTLRPSSRGRVAPVEPSPPDSPDMNPRRNYSTSSVNLNRAPSGRAPSAFLDDMLDEQGQPFSGQYPPGPDGQYYSQSPSPPGHRRY